MHASWPPFRDFHIRSRTVVGKVVMQHAAARRRVQWPQLRSRSRLPREHRAHRAAVATRTRYDPDTRTLRSTCVRARRLDRSRTVQGSLSLLFPDRWQVNRGKQSEAERLEQKLAERKREEELDEERRRNRELGSDCLKRHHAAVQQQCEEEERAAQKRALAAEELPLLNCDGSPDFVVCLAKRD